MFSLLFYTLTLDVVLSLREGRGRRIVWLLPLLYALWANLHIQFVNGFFLLGLACAAPIVDRVFRLGVSDDTAATAGFAPGGAWSLSPPPAPRRRSSILTMPACTSP